MPDARDDVNKFPSNRTKIFGRTDTDQDKQVRVNAAGDLIVDLDAVGVNDAGGNRVNPATEETLEAIKAAVEIMDDWDELDRAKVNPIVGQAGVQGGAGVTSANTQRTNTATDSPDAVSLAIIDDWDESDRAKVNPIVGQAGVQGGAGATSANTQRTNTATDSPDAVSLAIIDDWDEADRAKVNPIVGQAGIEANAGITTVKTTRVVTATDDPNLASLKVVGSGPELLAQRVTLAMESRTLRVKPAPRTYTTPDGVSVGSVASIISAATSGAGVTIDSSGNGHHGSFVGSPPATIVSPWGGFQTALDFLGGYMNCGATGTGTGGNFTIEFRYRPASSTGIHYLSSRQEVANFGLLVYTINGFFGYSYTLAGGASQNDITTTAPALAGVKYIVRLTYDGTTYRFYIDGTLVHSIVATRYATPGAFPLTIGGSAFVSDGTGDDGVIDEYRLSNIARSTGASYVVDTVPFVTDANTLVLYHMDDSGVASNITFYVDPRSRRGIHYAIGSTAALTSPYLPPGKGLTVETAQNVSAIRESGATADVNVFVIRGD